MSTDSRRSRTSRAGTAPTCLSAADRVRDLDVARHRMAPLHARDAARALRALRADPRHQPLPRARRGSPRPGPAPRDARGRLAACGRAREAPSRQDVGARRGRAHHAPLLDQSHLEVAWHAGQYQALPPVYIQNSALEIAWTRVVTETGTREGTSSLPSHAGLRGLQRRRRGGLGARGTPPRRRSGVAPAVGRPPYAAAHT